MTNRRNFLTVVAALGVLNGARAQAPAAPRIGWISYGAPGTTLDSFEEGMRATYGPNLNDAYRRLATYVDRLLKGARADTLPVELPTRFELVVNLKTAKALGIAIPQSVFLRADQVIQ